MVIYWVDGNDPEWRAVYSSYSKKEPKRFRDIEVLKYIFRGLELYLPWVRNVHFVTWGHLPDWLDVSHPKLKVHTHEDIFYFKDALPVFNSSSIEANFANIPGLSEKFILFNDDMLVLKPLSESRFFVENKPVDFIKLSFPRAGFFYNRIKPQNAQHVKFINNAYKFLPSVFTFSLLNKGIFSKRYSIKDNVVNLLYLMLGKIFWFEVYHQPQPHLKSTWNKFLASDDGHVIKSTVYSRFRSENDVNQYLYRYLNLSNGNFYPKKESDHCSAYIKGEDDLTEELFDFSLLCICEDDTMSDNDFYAMKNKLNRILNDKFPLKSSYEK